ASGAFQSSAVPNLIPPGTVGYYAFGSFLSPRYQFASASGHQDNPYGVGDGRTDGEIPPVPTKQTPRPLGTDRIGALVVTPNPALHPPPWPAAVYGPGATSRPAAASCPPASPSTAFSRGSSRPSSTTWRWVARSRPAWTSRRSGPTSSTRPRSCTTG